MAHFTVGDESPREASSAPPTQSNPFPAQIALTPEKLICVIHMLSAPTKILLRMRKFKQRVN